MLLLHGSQDETKILKSVYSENKKASRGKVFEAFSYY